MEVVGSEAGVGTLFCRRCVDALPGVDDEDDEDETAAGSGALVIIASAPPREDTTADIGAGRSIILAA